MSIKFNTTKLLMKTTTDKPITASAVHYMINLTEDFIKAITIAADKQKDVKNNLRQTHGLRRKARLTEEDIREVLRRPPSTD